MSYQRGANQANLNFRSLCYLGSSSFIGLNTGYASSLLTLVKSFIQGLLCITGTDRCPAVPQGEHASAGNLGLTAV